MAGFDEASAQALMERATGLMWRWGAAGLAAMAALAVLAALVIHDRGFDISDEAYYVLSASLPGSIEAYISPQHWVLAPLWQISGDLPRFRLVGLAVQILASAVLAQGVVAAARRIRLPLGPAPFVSVFALSLLGALLYMTTINLSPSYNLLAAAGACLAIGFALLAGASGKTVPAMLLCACSGLALTVEFASKPSSGVSTVLLIPAVLWAASGLALRSMLLWLLIGLVFGTSLVCLTLTQGPWSETRTALSDGLALFRIVQSEPIQARLLRYLLEYLSFSGWMLVGFLPFVAAFAAYLLRPRAWLAWLALAALLAMLAAGGHLLGGTEGSPYRYLRQIGALLILLLATVLLAGPALTKSPRGAMLAAALFLAPYSVAIGTGNAIFTQVIVAAAPWAASMGLLSALARPGTPRFLSLALAASFAITAASQIVTSVFRDAYHLAAPFSAQSEQVEVGVLGQIRLDPATAAFVADLKAAAETCGIGPALPYLGLYNVPGVALAFAAVPVRSPWINDLAQAEVILTPERLAALESAILVRRIGRDGTWPALPAALDNLQSGFRLCGTASYPFADQKMEIWLKQ